MSEQQPSFPLPYDFPDGKVWAAIHGGVVMDMVYMSVPPGVSFAVHRQRSRKKLAVSGSVWSGAVKGGRFVPAYESNDVRHTGECNTAREVHA